MVTVFLWSRIHGLDLATAKADRVAILIYTSLHFDPINPVGAIYKLHTKVGVGVLGR